MVKVTLNNILICTSYDLLEFCDPYYLQDQMLGAAHQAPSTVINNLMRANNNYSFFMSLLIRVKVAVRAGKATGSDVKNLMMKRDILDSIVDVLKKKYEAGSRIWTLHHDDLQMTGGRRGFPDQT